MNRKHGTKKLDDMMQELYDAILSLDSASELDIFLRDLCTPQELMNLAERWQVCRLLHQGTMSYREISALTGASLATIGRVARFLHIEPHQGYQLALARMQGKATKK